MSVLSKTYLRYPNNSSLGKDSPKVFRHNVLRDLENKYHSDIRDRELDESNISINKRSMDIEKTNNSQDDLSFKTVVGEISRTDVDNIIKDSTLGKLQAKYDAGIQLALSFGISSPEFRDQAISLRETYNHLNARRKKLGLPRIPPSPPISEAERLIKADYRARKRLAKPTPAGS